jgi:hypothetical protein
MRNIVIPSEIAVTFTVSNGRYNPHPPFTTHEILPFVEVNKITTFHSVY